MLHGKVDFQLIREKFEENNQKEYASIGEYQEKSIHYILKNYFEPDLSSQEVKIGNFIADIYNEEGIIEIQTRNFYKLKEKLQFFLSEGYQVTIVYPIIVNKMIITMKNEDNDALFRKSPSHKTAFSALSEVYTIREFLKFDNLHFHFVYLDALDVKERVNKKKIFDKDKKSIDKIPLKIIKEEDYSSYLDFKKIIEDIDYRFSAKELKKIKKCALKELRISLSLLKQLNLVKVVEKRGREYIYEVVK